MSLIADIHDDMENGAIRLITEYQARLFSDAVKICGNAADAEDLVNRTFVKAINCLSQHKPEKDFYGWMKVILLNLHRDDLSRPVTRGTAPVESEALERYAGADWSTDEEILRNSDSEALREALRQMKPRDRELVLMRYYEDLSLKEIANFLNMPVSTVGRRIQIVRRLLAGKLGAMLGKTKKPLAVLGVILLGVAALFGAYQAGLLGKVEEKEGPEEVDLVEARMEVTAIAKPLDSGSGVSAAQADGDFSIASAEQAQEQGGASVPRQENDLILKQQPNEGTNEMKITSTLKSVAAAALTTVALASDGVTIDVTKVQQRYPWNGLVDIDYTITRDQGESALDPAKHSVRISVVNGDVTPAVTNVAHVFRQGAIPVSDGAHRVTWDANAEGINFKSQDVTVFAEVVRYAEKYMVIDVSGGPNTNCYPVTYLHGAPEGGFNRDEDKDEYKGNKIVLRLIPPGSFVMGSPTTEPGCVGKSGNTSYDTSAREVQHAVAITKPFYIGIFQITQKQYKNVMNDNPSSHTDNYCPVEGITYNVIRGTADTGTHRYDWPHNQDVDMQNSFMGKLRAKCKEWGGETYDKDVAGLFDLPTDAQWEYACRARTTTPYNNGVACATDGSLDTQLGLLGCYTRNRAAKYPAVVGSYAPNDWGLYDMHGNVWEWCLDWYREDVQNIENPTLDPVGPGAGEAGSPKRIKRGGGFDDPARSCRSAFRSSYVPGDVSVANGFRLSMTLP